MKQAVHLYSRPECGLKRGPVAQEDAFHSDDFEACGLKVTKGEYFVQTGVSNRYLAGRMLSSRVIAVHDELQILLRFEQNVTKIRIM